MGDEQRAEREEGIFVVMMRLDKLLAHQGWGTRKEVNALIREGHVRVNGVPVTLPKTKVETDDAIAVDDTTVSYQKYVYYMLNKPMGVISATRDRRTTVVDLLAPCDREGRELFPVGRLDKDTTGLLLLTDDGALAHALLSPKRHVPKTYRATLDAPLAEEDIDSLRHGILLLPERIVTQPAEVVREEACVYRVTIQEGKYHQIKRMFAYCQRTVNALERLSMGPLELDPTLAPGAYRPLTGEEREALEMVRSGHRAGKTMGTPTQE